MRHRRRHRPGAPRADRARDPFAERTAGRTTRTVLPRRTISLGHRRLSIIDLTGGTSRSPTRTATIRLVCNGEIYNYPELRARARGRGHRFRTRTDTEVIVHLYEELGRPRASSACAACSPSPSGTPRRAGSCSRATTSARSRSSIALARRGLRLRLGGQGHVLAGGLLPREARPRRRCGTTSRCATSRTATRSSGASTSSRRPPSRCSRAGGVTQEKYWRSPSARSSPHDEAAIADGLDALLRDTVKLAPAQRRPGGHLPQRRHRLEHRDRDDGRRHRRPLPDLLDRRQGRRLQRAALGAHRRAEVRPAGRERIVEADMIHLIPAMVAAMDEPADPFGAGVYLVSQLGRRGGQGRAQRGRRRRELRRLRPLRRAAPGGDLQRAPGLVAPPGHGAGDQAGAGELRLQEPRAEARVAQRHVVLLAAASATRAA